MEGGSHIARHGEGNLVLVIIPFEGDSDIEAAGPILSNFVDALEGGDQVVGMFFSLVLDSKIIDH
jgi:hypothetical protein